MRTALLALLVPAMVMAGCSDQRAPFAPSVEPPIQPPVEPPVLGPVDTAISAVVDWRAFWVVHDTAAAVFDLTGAMLNVIGRRASGDSTEIIQITLSGFDGAGAYSLAGFDNVGRSGVAVYGWTGGAAYWSDAVPRRTDSAWVTAYDSVKGHIAGRFHFVGHTGAGDTVVVTEGRFEGVVQRHGE